MEASFRDFVAVLNSHHPQIKLKCNLQNQQVKFLDTVVFFTPILASGNKKLATKVYLKDTDRHTLLHKSSYHPQRTYLRLIKLQLIRFHRIDTFPDDVEEATRILFAALTQRGYSKRFLRNIKTEVKAILMHHREHKREGESLPLIPMVETFSHHLGGFNAKLRSNFRRTQESCEPLTKFRMIRAYRRNKNLKDMLVHTAVDKIKIKG